MNDTIDTARSLIDYNVEEFLKDIKSVARIDYKKLHSHEVDYPIFHPLDTDFIALEQIYYFRVIEEKIRDHLITETLLGLFDLYGHKCRITEKNKIVHFTYRNEIFGKEYPFAFIVEKEDKRIGIRYSNLERDEHDEVYEDIEYYQLDHIEIIDWTDTDRYFRLNELYDEEYDGLVSFTSLRKFFDDHFSDDIYDIYLCSARDAVREAKEIIGLQSIPRLTSKNLSDLKSRFILSLSNLSIKDLAYREFSENGEMTGNYKVPLPTEDLDLLEKRLSTIRLGDILIGKSDFATCFFTAEYQYNIFKTGNDAFFDYTSVAVGYFKSVELLLEKLTWATFDQPEHEELFIKCTRLSSDVPDDDFKRIGPKAVRHIRFKEEYKDFFSNEMGPLIHFLTHNKHGWYITNHGLTTARDHLLNYSQGCRNEHLHKDIISDIETLDFIRSNTILCMMYLIGGYRYGDGSTATAILGEDDDSYNRFYKTMLKIPLYRYIIKFNGKEEINAIRLPEQEEPQYDERGNIISTIKFLRVDTFEGIYLEEFFSSSSKKDNLDSVVISKDNMPERIYWYSAKSGKTLIEF